MAWDYNDRIKELFSNATNQTESSHFGEMQNPDGVGQYGSISCGDAIVFYFNVEKNIENPLKDRIVKASYLTFGCTSAIASSEALCIILEQHKPTPLEALKITAQEIVECLGGMPDQKIHCSVMGAEVLQIAVEDWANKRGINLAEAFGKEIEVGGEILCDCYDLTDQFIRTKIYELDLKTLEQITDSTKAGGACGNCRQVAGGIKDILAEVNGAREAKSNKQMKEILPLEIEHLKERVESFFQTELPVELASLRAKATFVEFKNGVAYCYIQSSGGGCPGGDLEVKSLIETALQKRVSSSIRVIDI